MKAKERMLCELSISDKAKIREEICRYYLTGKILLKTIAEKYRIAPMSASVLAEQVVAEKITSWISSRKKKETIKQTAP